MKKDALWSLQCHDYVSTIDDTRIDECNEEIWQPGDVLRGRRGNSDNHSRGPHRAIRRGVRLHEKSGTKMQAIEKRDNQDSIKYLGRMVDKHGIRPDRDAVEAVLTWKSPKAELQLMSFLDFANYYREFIKGYADKMYPMQQLMRHKGKKFTWNNAAEESFLGIKKKLSKAPVLGMPAEKGVYVLNTDASVIAISGILHQEQERNGKKVLRPIA